MAEVTAEDLVHYAGLRDELTAALKAHGSTLFEAKSTAPHTGLVNQGATCYLVRVTAGGRMHVAPCAHV
jgi:hypothetical protein